MTRSAACAALVVCLGAPALAQPMVLPGARLSNEPGAAQAPAVPFPVEPGAPAARPPGEPAPVRLPPVRAVSEESVLGRELRLNGETGSFRMERVGGASRARVTLRGSRLSPPGEACELVINEPVPLHLGAGPRGCLATSSRLPRAR